MRELKNLSAVIAEAKKFEMTDEQLVDTLGKITSAWSWGKSDRDIAEQVNTKRSN